MSGTEAAHVIGETVVAKMNLAPGDILVVKVNHHIPAEAHVRIRDKMAAILPDGVQCIVIDSSVDLSVLTRAEIEAKAA